MITPFINLCSQELDGILEDAQVDCKQLEDDLKATEKERDDLDLKLVEKVSCNEGDSSVTVLNKEHRCLERGKKLILQIIMVCILLCV